MGVGEGDSAAFGQQVDAAVFQPAMTEQDVSTVVDALRKAVTR
jgi:hypothetical protein